MKNILSISHSSSFRSSDAERGVVALCSKSSRYSLINQSRSTRGRTHARENRPIPNTGILILLLLFSLFIISCEQPFEPVQENEEYFFSINGYLDATADTQWLRIMSVRESLLQEEVPDVPTVTLQHIESGEQAAMSDSLFQFSDGRYAYNFWTTMPIEPEQSYRIIVEAADGRMSSAETTLPADFPVPRFREPEFGDDILIVEQVPRLADIQVQYRLRFDRTGEEFEVTFPYFEFSVFIPPTTYRIPINPAFPRAQIIEAYCDVTAFERNVFVASGGPEWPDFLSLDRHTIALPDGVSNVVNGVGFFGGIISKTFPYIDIEGERGLFTAPCPS